MNASWLDAENHCVSLDAHLWAVNSHDEWTSIYEAINKYDGLWDGGFTSVGTGMLILNAHMIFIGLKYGNTKVTYILFDQVVYMFIITRPGRKKSIFESICINQIEYYNHCIT